MSQDAVDGLFEAIFEPQEWPRALQRIAGSLNSAGCLFLPEDGVLVPGMVPSTGIAEVFEAFIAGGWYQVDTRAERAWRLADAGHRILTESQLFSEEERRRSLVHQELYFRFRLPWWGSLIVDAEEGHRWCLPLLRTAEQGPLTPTDSRQLTRLSPHLGRVLRTARRILNLEACNQVALFDQIGIPALVLDRRSRVIAWNAGAEGLFQPEFSVVAGKVRLANAAAAAAVDRLCTLAARAKHLDEIDVPPVLVSTSSGRRLMFDAVPALGRAADLLGMLGAILMVTDLDQRRITPERILKGVFELTPAEIRLARKLQSGLSLVEASESIGISRETAKLQLNRIFRKTGTNRQSDTISLLERISRSS